MKRFLLLATGAVVLAQPPNALDWQVEVQYRAILGPDRSIPFHHQVPESSTATLFGLSMAPAGLISRRKNTGG